MALQDIKAKMFGKEDTKFHLWMYSLKGVSSVYASTKSLVKGSKNPRSKDSFLSVSSVVTMEAGHLLFHKYFCKCICN